MHNHLRKEKFIEVHTPKIIASATEGGTSLFEMKYFDKTAYLAQSPQLYKQMLMGGGLEKVYEVGPAFRAEEHNTPRHLNEFISIDIEMSFADDDVVMGVMERLVDSLYEKQDKSIRYRLFWTNKSTEKGFLRNSDKIEKRKKSCKMSRW